MQKSLINLNNKSKYLVNYIFIEKYYKKISTENEVLFFNISKF